MGLRRSRKQQRKKQTLNVKNICKRQMARCQGLKDKQKNPHSGFHGRTTTTGALQSMNIDHLMKDPSSLAIKEPKQWVHTTEHESMI
jgi:hypothetical protein